MKPWWGRSIGLIGVLGVVAVTGCGRAGERAGEKRAEKILESKLGGNADVDVSGDKIRVKSAHGEMQAGAGTKLPDDFPSDVYVDPRATIEFAMRNPNSFMLSLNTPELLSAVNDTYGREMGAQGWTEASRIGAGEQQMVVFNKENRRVQVTITKKNETTQILLTVTQRDG